MSIDIKLVFVGQRQLLQYLTTLPSRMRSTTRRVFRKWGPDLTSLAADLSPSDKLRSIDDRRRPESERLARQWAWEVTGLSSPELDIGNLDPKMPFILFPTRGGKIITPREKDYLVFFWRGGWHRKDSVKKGSTPGQPVHDWALQSFDLDGQISFLADQLIAPTV